MSRYRKIDMRLYGDEKYRRLTPCPPCGQALWWHLIAGEQTGQIPGLFKIGEAGFADQLGWTLKGFREAFGEVLREGMVKADWHSRLVWVPNSIKYNEPASPNVVKSWKHAWDELPECPLKVEAYHRIKAFMEGFTKGFQEAFAKACREPFVKPLANQEQEQEHEQEQEQEQEQEFRGSRGFTKPSIEDVRLYCEERGNNVDPARFVNFYQSKGWLVGKSPMKDWRAAVQNWEKNSHSSNNKPGLYDGLKEFLKVGGE